MQKKRHHFVPKAYLKAFCNSKGRVLVYRKDEPQTAHPLSPDATQFRNYYYSQPTPDGGQDNNGFEDLFSTIESEWPETVARLAAGGDVNDRLTNILEFMSLQRVRVPAARDFAEAINAHTIKRALAKVEEQGKRPPPPPGLENLRSKVLQVAVDTHSSLHAMVAMFLGMGSFYDLIGLAVVHNMTNRPFLSSDNPVVWFDPSVSFEDQQPYLVSRNGGQIMLIFPVSSKVAIIGGTEYVKSYAQCGLTHIDVGDEKWILMANEQICRFAYETVLASESGQEDLILQFADTSPVLETTMLPGKNDLLIIHHMVFGKRTSKVKW